MMYDAYLRFPRAFYDRHATGEVISRATNDIYPVRYFIGWGVVQAIQSMMMLVGAAIVLVSVNARLTLFAALAMPPIAVLTYVFAHKVFPISRIVQAKKGHLTEATDEAVVGIEMVQAFGREDDVRERFTGRAEAVRSETMRQAGVEARFLPGLIFLPSLGIAAVLWFGGRDAIEGNLTIGQFTLFITLLLQLVWPLEALGWIINLGQRATAAASRSFAWLDSIESLPEPAQPRSASRRAAPIRIENVHFSYGVGKEVLSGIDLEVASRRDRRSLRRRPARARRRCSTCCRGSTTRPPGRVLLGGVDSRELALPELRRSVALVTQKPVLFSIPLRDNLLAARPDADWVDVLAACEAAGVAAFVDGLPDGYDTLIGERGRQPLRRPAPARRARARARRAGARDRARRPHVGRRHGDRAAPRLDAPPRGRGTHRPDRRPAPLDHPRRRPRCRAPRRPHRRERRAPRPDPARRRLHRAVRRRGPCSLSGAPACRASGATPSAAGAGSPS